MLKKKEEEKEEREKNKQTNKQEQTRSHKLLKKRIQVQN